MSAWREGEEVEGISEKIHYSSLKDSIIILRFMDEEDLLV